MDEFAVRSREPRSVDLARLILQDARKSTKTKDIGALQQHKKNGARIRRILRIMLADPRIGAELDASPAVAEGMLQHALLINATDAVRVLAADERIPLRAALNCNQKISPAALRALWRCERLKPAGLSALLLSLVHTHIQNNGSRIHKAVDRLVERMMHCGLPRDEHIAHAFQLAKMWGEYGILQTLQFFSSDEVFIESR